MLDHYGKTWPSIHPVNKEIKKQERIPVGAVVYHSMHWARGSRVSAQGVVCQGEGVSAGGGVSARHPFRVDRMTDAFENITLPQLRYNVTIDNVTKYSQYDTDHEWSGWMIWRRLMMDPLEM